MSPPNYIPYDMKRPKRTAGDVESEVFAQTTCLMEGRAKHCAHLCESPIERIALAALVGLLPGPEVVERAKMLDGQEWDFAIVPQMRFKGYRLDFAIFKRESRAFFDLECDGRLFHQDQGQQSADNERSINLWKHGCLVRRVSGSALFRNAIEALAPFAQEVRRA